MKSFLPLLSLTLVFASCSSAYKTGQTPDDVYFSPERPQAEYVRVDNDEDRYYRGSQEQGNDYYNYEEERYLRMKVRNRNRWTYLDNDFYSYNPYFYNNYNYYYNSPWNSYSYWNQYYNPYYHQVVIYGPKAPLSNMPRTINLRVFDNPQNTTNRAGSFNSKNRNYNSSTNSSSAPRRNVGNDLRNIFNSGNSNNTPSSSGNSSSRMSTNSSSSSSSSSSSNSSSGSSSAPARRF